MRRPHMPMTTSSSGRGSDGDSIGNTEVLSRKGEKGRRLRKGHTRGWGIYCVDLPRIEGMNLRRDVRAGVQRRRRRIHGYPESRPECPHPISIRLEGWGCVYSWPAAWSISTDGRSHEVIAVELPFRCLLFVSRRVHRHVFSRADFILVHIATEVLPA